ncbi:MAG: mechanosensitive ion channel family protein, partial [Pseudomonadota bacterium]
METWEALLNQTLWVKAAVVVTVTLFGYWLLRTLIGVVSNRLRSWHAGPRSKFYGFAVEMLSRTSRLLIFVFALMIGVKLVGLPSRWESTLAHGWFVILAFQVALWLDCGVRLWMESLLFEPGKARNPVTTTIIGVMLRIVVWTMM